MCLNHITHINIKSLAGHDIKYVEEFKYLSSYIGSTQHGVSIRIGSSWAALNSLKIIWKSNLSSKPKRNFFRATVETVLRNSECSITLESTTLTTLSRGRHMRTYLDTLRINYEITRCAQMRNYR